MSDAEQLMLYDANKRSTLVAYLLWWFLGWFGAHRFYLKRRASAVMMLVLGLVAVVLFLIGIFVSANTLDSGAPLSDEAGAALIIAILSATVLAVLQAIDLFLIPGMVRKVNSELAQRLAGGYLRGGQYPFKE